MLEKIVNVFHTIWIYFLISLLKEYVILTREDFTLLKNRSDKLIQGKTSDVKRVGMV